jgi:hypothetical protein
MKQRGFRRCPTCSNKLQKRGLTAAGTQRWFCPHCVSSATRPRTDLSRAFVLERFVAWLMGKQSQVELSHNLTDRMWRIQTAWCWQVVPKPTFTGETYSIILLDGIRIGSLVCLIARTPQYVIGWTWAGWESSITWERLLNKLPAPAVVVCDGQKGILLAIARCWPKTRIQRCIFHVWQNIRVKLTLHPHIIAGQELLTLTKVLLRGIATKEAAELWQEQLSSWEQRHGSFIRERTYVSQPGPGKHNWWYTHGRLRSAYRQLTKLIQDNQLFTYLNETVTTAPIPRTTNYVEGGINSQLRTKLKLHRGMSEEHQRRLVEWYLYGRTEAPKPPRNFL